jgi:hypothetical protein
MIREDMKFDVRSLRHRTRRNELSPAEVEKHLKDLPDDADEAENTKTEFVASFEEKNYKQ